MAKQRGKNLIRILDLVGRLDVIIASSLMFGIAVIAVWGVFTRYILSQPSAWIEELSLAMFIWLAFFGVSILARRGEIISIEYFVLLLP